MAVHRRGTGGVPPPPPGPPPPPPQTKAIVVGEKHNSQEGTSGRSIFGARPFGSRTPPFQYFPVAPPSLTGAISIRLTAWASAGLEQALRTLGL